MKSRIILLFDNQFLFAHGFTSITNNSQMATSLKEPPAAMIEEWMKLARMEIDASLVLKHNKVQNICKRFVDHLLCIIIPLSKFSV